MPPNTDASKEELASELPPVPPFVPSQSHCEEHEAVGLPPGICTSPLAVFNQLFTQEIWQSLSDNTNAYHDYRHPSFTTTTTTTYPTTTSTTTSSTDNNSRPWRNTNPGELKVWIGLLFYMGIVGCPEISDYWEWLKPLPMSAMSLSRFLQLKRYLHVSPPEELDTSSEWWVKMEPMSSLAQERCKECYIPSSNIGIDEVMVTSEGQSAHPLSMPDEPMDHGSKLFALSDRGYTYHWIYHSKGQVASTESKRMFQSILYDLTVFILMHDQT